MEFSKIATPATSATQQAASLVSIGYGVSSLPLLGMTCAQAIERATSAATAYYNPSLQLQLPWQH
ncbi:MAG TPA: hypothetical protein VG274_05370 [Rhizomicrobium sp.]|nr:hypothetical protein [Rhizomicrobium sp.]